MHDFLKPEDTAFRAELARHDRALVLYRGDHCPYSESFRKAFEAAQVPGWGLLMREVEEGGWGPVAEKEGIEVTPTVVAYRDGKEVARLEAKVMIGITKPRFEAWLKSLAA